MLGLAYWPLLLWLPTLTLQGLSILYFGKGAQAAVRSLTGLLIDTPVNGFLKIVWIVMLVLCLDCVRVAATTPRGTASASTATPQVYEAFAAKEGALVLTLNLISMLAINSAHVLSMQCAKLEIDRDVMKKQAQQQGQFSMKLIEADKKDAAAGVPTESKMPEGKLADSKESEGEVRKRE